MKLVLFGEILTPFLFKKRTFHLKGCKWQITHTKRVPYVKVAIAFPSYPFACIGYLGQLTVTYKCNTLEVAKRKVKSLKNIYRIGRNKSLELGRICWLEGRVENSSSPKKHRQYGKLKIRKGLPSQLPYAIQDLLLYGLLHDFFHTSIHQSKIYVEPQITDQVFAELLRQSHSSNSHVLIKTFKKYDGIASYMTRKFKAPRNNRYNWQIPEEIQTIDFNALANQIAQEVNKRNVFKLYQLIYHSKELEQLNESFNFGHTSIRFHLLLIANFIVRDYLHGYLDHFLSTYRGQFSHSNEKKSVAS